MHFFVTAEQRAFFHKHNHLELEGLFSQEQLALLKESIRALRSGHSASCFSMYDLWRKSQVIKKITQKLSVAELASAIFNVPIVRIAFDQFFSVPESMTPAPVFHHPFSLLDFSSIKPLLGGLLLYLGEKEHSSQAFIPRIGSALFVSALCPIPWPDLCSLAPVDLFFLAFAPKHTFYRQEDRDIHAPALKKLGYVYNDHLREELHPLLFGKK